MSRWTVRAASVVAAALVATSCAPTGPRHGEPVERPEPVVSEPVAPTETVVLSGGSPAALAGQSAATFFDSAPLAVVATPETAVRAGSVGVALGVPVLTADSGEVVSRELARLGTETVLAVGGPDLPRGQDEVDVVEAPADPDALADLTRLDAGTDEIAPRDAVDTLAGLDPSRPVLLDVGGSDGPGGAAGAGNSGDADPTLPATRRPDPPAGDVVVMSTGEPEQAAAVATARAAGAAVQVVPGGDPRASGATVEQTAEHDPEAVVGLGRAFGDDETLSWRAQAAATGAQLPGGGQLALPGRTYVALYGSPGSPELGVLGEQGTEETISRAREVAEDYEDLTDDEVVPTLEVIATVASSASGDDGDYSHEIPVDELRPLVEAAGESGQYVVLDLQPGRTDFLTQAQRYEELLALPHVGLALDPEWRLGPDEEHLEQIGHVDAAEVEEVATWLADLTREEALPQKLFVLHAFRTSMLPDLEQADLDRSELAVLLHADGQGSQSDKESTWNALHRHAPGIAWWGWKNFLDEDSPVLSPEQTMRVAPTPHFISYQ
ncbi:hypothetical protein [Georgenia deserti]|uniref:Cell wall-binding repeat-containing protein n=1 Tax=Georgenia deserti TaxID=2093781 RepID=A0ABW4LBB0_9MICO